MPKPSSEEKCLVIYDGGITGSEETLEFDAQHTFKVRRKVSLFTGADLLHEHSCKHSSMLTQVGAF